MKNLTSIALALAFSLTILPAFAQSNGSAPVAGEGPGGSGAGQPAAGPSKSNAAAPAADSTMMMKKPAGGADPAKPAGSSTAD